ncbi:ABC transporter permease subunit [bacterium]|nr:ABC transporter permease subunit [bacterium]
MFKILVVKEMQRSIGSLRFLLILLLSLILFTVSGILFIQTYKQRLNDYQTQYLNNDEQLRERAVHLNQLSGNTQYLLRHPIVSELLASGAERLVPDRIAMTSFSYGNYENIDRQNYKLNEYHDFDWVFIIGIIFSFAALVLMFDRISGERESGVLRQQCANSVSRFEIIAANYVAGLLTLFIALAVGIVLNLLIVSIGVHSPIVLEYPVSIVALLISSFLYLSLFLLIGLFISSRVRKSASGLAIALLVWTTVVIFLPSGGAMLGQKIHKISSSYEYTARIRAAWNDIWMNAPVPEARGYWDGRDFPYLKERAELVNTLDNMRDTYRHERFLELLAQVNTARNFTRVSPFSLLKYAGESFAGTGLYGFVNFYNQGRIHRTTFRNFIEQKDAEDPESYHQICSWMPEGYSEAEVDFDDIPRFVYQEPGFAEKGAHAGVDLILLAVFYLIAAMAAITSFIKYDVR